MSKDLKKKESTEMTFDEARPDYIGEETRGQENMGTDDLVIPRLAILQQLSPQISKNNPEYIEGAESGMMFNTVTRELYDDGVFFIPCHYVKEWLIWMRQDAGGGFNGAFANELEAKNEFAEKGYDDTYEIVDTANHYGLLFTSTDSVNDICISMSKSQMKPHRNFGTLIKMAGGDRFSRVYKVATVMEKNKAGKEYYNFKIVAKGYAPKDLYLQGEKLYEAMQTSLRPVAQTTTPGSSSDSKAEF